MQTKKEMKQTNLQKMIALLLSIICCICMTGMHMTQAAEKQPQILPTDVSKASSGCVLVGIEGSFVTEVQAALDRVNEIRREACTEGVPDPSNPGRKLTLSDYVPIQWSSSLEYIARIRAAEAIVLVDHQRPNGTVCFSLKAPDGTSSYGEVLAWNSSSSSNMVRGINQWYGEKEDWVAQNSGAVTGHYTSMIDPENKYIGLGAFISEFGSWRCCVSGEFSSRNGSGSAAADAVDHCIQTIEVKKSDVQELKIFLDGEEVSDDHLLGLGKQVVLSGKMKVVTEDGTAFCDSLDNLTWTSSDASVAEVDDSGTVTAKKAGNATISASDGSGMSASCKIMVGQTKLSEDDVILSQDVFQYNGKVRKPKVTVQENETAVDASKYTVSYSKGCKNVGIYTVTVSMKGNNGGTVKKQFAIIPKGTSLTSLKGGKGTITASWKRQKQADGYIIRVMDEHGYTERYVYGNKNTKLVIDDLERKYTYYVSIRTYKEAAGQAICSEWTKEKKVSTK